MRYWNPEIEAMSRELQSEMQERKLRNMVRQVYYHSPFYRSLFYQNRLDPADIKTQADLARLPLTRKEDLIDNPREFILQPNEISLSKTLPIEKRLRQAYDRFTFDEKIVTELRQEYKPTLFVVSSGRESGTPSPVFYTRYDMDIMAEIGGRMAIGAGMTEESFFHIGFPAGLHMAFWQCVEASEAIGCLSIRHGSEKISQQALILDRFGVSELAATPPVIDLLSREAEQNGLNCSRLKTIIAAGERFPAGLKKRVCERFASAGASPRILEAYGTTEMKVAFLECGEGEGYHVMPDTHLVEVLDANTHEPMGERERGLITFTHIDFRGSVFLRFLTNDVCEGGLTHEPCECGRTTPRILGPITRTFDGGTPVDVAALDDFLAETLDTYLIVVEGGSVTIRTADALPDLAGKLQKRFSPVPRIDKEEKNALAREIADKWKGKRIVSL